MSFEHKLVDFRSTNKYSVEFVLPYLQPNIAALNVHRVIRVEQYLYPTELVTTVQILNTERAITWSCYFSDNTLPTDPVTFYNLLNTITGWNRIFTTSRTLIDFTFSYSSMS